MQSILRTLCVLLAIAVIAGCSSTPRSGSGGKWVGHTETGQASFYADRFQNRKTASGEPYVRNGKSVVVRINDRGPFVRGRVIDLSRSAFKSIGNTSVGLLNVRIEVIR